MTKGGRPLRAYGYTPAGAVDEAEAEVVRTVATRLLEGATVRGVTAWLNGEGLKTVSGRHWEPITVRRMLLNPRIAGLDGDGNQKNPGVLDQDTYRRIHKLLSDPKRRAPTVSRSYLLTGGIAVCGRCGSPLVSRPSNGGRRGYVCRSGPPTNGCGRIRVAADPFEDEIVARALARLASARTRAKLAAALQRRHEQMSRDEDETATLKDRLADLGRDYADGKIGRVEFHAARDRVDDRLNKLSRSLGDAQRLADVEAAVAFPDTQIEDLLLWWAEASVTQRRSLLALLIERIEVGPVENRGSRMFDPERLRITWR